MDLFTKILIAYSVRVILVVAILITLPWKLVLYFCIFIVSLYFLPMFPPRSQQSQDRRAMKTKDILSELYPRKTDAEQEKMFADSLIKLVQYDVEDTPSLQRFKTISVNSNCSFARKAKLWGSPAWQEGLTLEDNIYRLIPMFLKFTVYCVHDKLDAFLIELPCDEYSTSIEKFGDAIYRVLKTLSDNDPGEMYCMNKSYIGKRGWVFEFNKITFFITTFAPFYPEDHPRYSFGADNSYILFQPELSFAFHDLPSDTPHTNWEEPVTVRDKIRVAFKDAGRPYKIPDSIYHPMSDEILRPIKETDSIYEWWKR
ncbi:hypothetical protein ACF0H5_019948 [Mactra antiquata]